ncbi:amine oxidase [Nitzschia inconspicua]|uniref:monoamine oxidase n=1 Tax=Nitzschia inconspicua TaxID=303405 RepID=A0A9K3Q3B6_9STRA|nr:amine oxidase [Nitzschia inconspicua]
MYHHCPSSSSVAPANQKILDLLIIGGGLSGIFVGHDYHHRHQRTATNPSISSATTATATTANTSSWKLLEARSVLGGRLANDDKGNRIDLGGAWVWPHHQPNLRNLLPQLDNITTFPQPDDSSSTRIENGAVSLVETLAKNLPEENILLNTPVQKLTWVKSHSEKDTTGSSYIQIETKATTNGTDGTDAATTTQLWRAKQVVIAVPPRLIFKHIQFDPILSATKRQAMESSHTWMAGVTKIAVVYPTAFWNETRQQQQQQRHNIQTNMGLPSHLGPAFQVYDASTRDGSVAAITFFALVKPGSSAANDDKELAKQVTQQLAQVWRYLKVDEDAIQSLLHSFTDIHVKRWPLEEYISEDPEPHQIHPHPHPLHALSESEWNGQLLFAGSESDWQSPGVMEGAIGSALRVLQDIP